MIDYNDLIYIKNYDLITLQCEKNKNYLNLDLTSYTFNAIGIHSSLKNKEFENNQTTEFYILLDKSPSSQNYILTQSSVALMTKDYMFLTATNNGELKLENIIGGYIRGKQILATNIPKNSRFICFDAFNPNNLQKPIKYNDNIMLRSSSFQTLVIINFDNNVSCNGQITSQEAIWKVINPRIPYIPDFIFKRKFQSFNTISYINYLENNQYKDQLNSSIKKKYDEKSLLTLSIENQEKALCEDLILNLMGMDGNYIRRTNKINVNEFQPANDNFRNFNLKFEIEPHLENKTCGKMIYNLDNSLLYMVQKILPLSIYHDKILQFLNLNNHVETGLVSKGLCDGIRKVLREYVLYLNQLENDFYNDKLDIQKFWYLSQASLKTLENLAKYILYLIRLCYQSTLVTGGALVNIIYSFMQNTTDVELKKLYKLLIDKAFKHLMMTMKNWVCKGLLEDPFLEFFVYKNKEYTVENLKELFYDFYWDKKYQIEIKNIPDILSLISQKIFFIGKYLNIIKECGKIIYCPYEAEFEKLIDLSIFETENFNNFTNLINNIYEWSNLTLMNLIFEQENVIKLFSSIKKVFFMESGDFYNSFINSASKLLNKEIIKDNIPFKMIESIIENSIRSTSLNNDEYKDLFFFSFSLKSISDDKLVLRKFNEALESSQTNLFFDLIDDLSKSKKEEEDFTHEIYMSLNDYKVIEALVLNMKVKWPLSLIISKKSLIQYRIIYRLLMLCKHAENKICEMWSVQQNFKEVEIEILKPSFFLRDKMISYLKNLIYFIFSEVIEPNYRIFIENLNKSKSLEELILHHNNFLDNIFKQCLLDKTELLELMLRINNAIIYFSNLFLRFYNLIYEDVNYLNIEANISRKINKFERKKLINQEETKVIRNFFVDNKTAGILNKFSSSFESFLREFLEKLNKE